MRLLGCPGLIKETIMVRLDAIGVYPALDTCWVMVRPVSAPQYLGRFILRLRALL